MIDTVRVVELMSEDDAMGLLRGLLATASELQEDVSPFLIKEIRKLISAARLVGAYEAEKRRNMPESGLVRERDADDLEYLIETLVKRAQNDVASRGKEGLMFANPPFEIPGEEHLPYIDMERNRIGQAVADNIKEHYECECWKQLVEDCKHIGAMAFARQVYLERGREHALQDVIDYTGTQASYDQFRRTNTSAPDQDGNSKK